jgi:hypothetical protein
MSKWYFIDVERGNIADKLQPRNINISLDVETDIVNK